ncbi:MAG: VWA domain-containing protein [Desulfobacterales bacterium]|nr:VWA domain-containing protein [Desulfobacterales bacterium]
METTILKFAAAARAAGLRIATSEVQECLALLPRVDILDETQFATLLRAHFAKSRLEQARFEHLYRLFFHELREDLDAAAMALGDQTASLRRELLAIEPPMPALAAIADFVAGEPAPYLQMLHAIQSEGRDDGAGPRGAGANLGSLVRRLPVLRALQRVRETLDGYLEAHLRTIHWETRRELRRHVEHRLGTARRLLADASPPGLSPPERKGPAEDLYGALGRTPLANLSPGEIIRLRDVIARLVRKLRDVVSRRQAARSRGVPDIRRTLRSATRTQGIPLALKFRHKPLRKGRIVVLCDVSGSVWASARFMLTMLYMLQDCFDRVRSFVFVDAPVDVTPLFDADDIDRALNEILRSNAIAYDAPTDYGRTLRLFKSRYMDTIDKKTTVIVIGDGRTNYGNPEEDILAEIRERARRLLWLNPEAESFWNSGDSEMRSYAAFCNEVRTCRNLNQLAAFIRELVL